MDEKETRFRRTLTKFLGSGVCGFCALDSAIAATEGQEVPESVLKCYRKQPITCIQKVNKELDEVPE